MLPPFLGVPSQPRSEGTYVKVVAVHSLIVQGDGHRCGCLPSLTDVGGDDEVVGVVPHQVHLKHAVQALGQKRGRNQSEHSGSQGPSLAGGAGQQGQGQMRCWDRSRTCQLPTPKWSALPCVMLAWLLALLPMSRPSGNFPPILLPLSAHQMPTISLLGGLVHFSISYSLWFQ